MIKTLVASAKPLAKVRACRFAVVHHVQARSVVFLVGDLSTHCTDGTGPKRIKYGALNVGAAVALVPPRAASG